jgi:N-ethylmaleimide reductase
MNKRSDKYGGSIANRARFLLEIVDAVTSVFHKSRVGVRLSPFVMPDSSPVELYSYVLQELDKRDVGYVHLIEPRMFGNRENEYFKGKGNVAASLLRKSFSGTLIIAGGFNRQSAIDIVEEGLADMVAFGRYFISNPDLPQRLRLNVPLNHYHRPTFYSYTDNGYTDYPFMQHI